MDLAKGDWVTLVEVIAVNSAAQLRKPIGLTAVGQEIELTYERKGSGATAQVRFETGERTAAGQTVLP
jgi:S1-C subfamily serine protease